MNKKYINIIFVVMHMAKKEEHIKFKCYVCDYGTNLKISYDKHLLTKKHIVKINKVVTGSEEPPKGTIYCTYCGTNQNECVETDNSYRIDELHHEIKLLKKEINYKDEAISDLRARERNLLTIIENGSIMMKTIVSAIDSQIKNCNDNSILEKLAEYVHNNNTII